MTKTEFLLTIPIPCQVDKWWELYRGSTLFPRSLFLGRGRGDTQGNNPLKCNEIVDLFIKTKRISEVTCSSSSSRPPSVRVDHGYSILIVCLAGASATMTVKANAWMAVPAASAARVCCLLDIADTKFSAGPPPCGSLCQLLFSCFEVPCNGSSPLWPISCEIFPGLCVNSYSTRQIKGTNILEESIILLIYIKWHYFYFTERKKTDFTDVVWYYITMLVRRQ